MYINAGRTESQKVLVRVYIYNIYECVYIDFKKLYGTEQCYCYFFQQPYHLDLELKILEKSGWNGNTENPI